MLEIMNMVLEICLFYLGLNMIMLLMALMEMKSRIKHDGIEKYKEWSKKPTIINKTKKNIFYPIYYIEQSINFLYNEGAFDE